MHREEKKMRCCNASKERALNAHMCEKDNTTYTICIYMHVFHIFCFQPCEF